MHVLHSYHQSRISKISSKLGLACSTQNCQESIKPYGNFTFPFTQSYFGRLTVKCINKLIIQTSVSHDACFLHVQSVNVYVRLLRYNCPGESAEPTGLSTYVKTTNKICLVKWTENHFTVTTLIPLVLANNASSGQLSVIRNFQVWLGAVAGEKTNLSFIIQCSCHISM